MLLPLGRFEMATTFIVGKMPDKTIIDVFDTLNAAFGANAAYYGGIVDFTSSIEVLRDRKGPTYLLTDVYFEPVGTGLRISIRRTVENHPSPYFDEIIIETIGGSAPTAEGALRVEEIIRSKVRFPNVSTPSKADGQITALLEKEMATITDMHRQLMADALDLRKRYELEEADRRSQFLTDQRSAELKIAENEQTSLEKIAQEKEALDNKLKEFDVSDHMRARRKQREEISAQVQTFLERPHGTLQSRSRFWLLLLLCLSAILVTGYFAYESFVLFSGQLKVALNNADTFQRGLTTNMLPDQQQELNQNLRNETYLSYALAGRGILSAGACIGFIIYSLNLLRRTYDDEIRASRDLQRYGMDINRASWVIETALEMTTKEGAVLPEKWIEGATANLFQPTAAKDSEVSSLAALGAIMGLGPEVNIGPTGASLKIPPKGAKKAAKEEE